MKKINIQFGLSLCLLFVCNFAIAKTINKSTNEKNVTVKKTTNKNDGGQLGVKVKDAKISGSDINHVKITEVFEASAAEDAGLQKGDIISAIDGKEIRNTSQFIQLIKANTSGETITIDYIRDGESLQTTAILKKQETANSILFNDGDTRIEWDDDGQITWNGDEDFTIKFPRMSNKGTMGVTLDNVQGEVVVTKVEKGSAAANAGMKQGDIIIDIDEQPITDKNEVGENLKDKKVGETLAVSYVRDGVTYKTPVVLKKSNSLFLFKSEDNEIKWGNNNDNWDFDWIEDNGNPSMGVILDDESEEGILINRTIENSGAEAAGLQKGDIITAINGQPIRTNEGLMEVINTQKAGDKIEVTYLRDNEVYITNVTLGRKRITIKKPRDFDVIFGEKEAADEKLEIYKKVETPTVSEEERLEFVQLDMYPNPNQGIFSLDFEIEAGTTTISIVNVDGKEVFNQELIDFKGIFSDKIDISDQPSGVYFLTILQNDKKIVKKVIYN